METILFIIIILLILVIVGFLVWIMGGISASRRETAGQMSGIGLLQQQLEALKAAQQGAAETVHKSLQAGHSVVTESMQSSQKILTQLNSQIGELQGTNKRLIEVGSEVRKLQDILGSPKIRGQMGEWSLANILTNIMPKDSYVLQHSFKDGKIVDCLVQIGDFGVPIDAKFPLPSFERFRMAENEAEKTTHRKQFIRDVSLHIDKIAENYIRPVEGTLDFAMMYIPAENVYYETIVNYGDGAKDILSYSLEKKVIPVSPNLLYAYLMTVVMGLQGMKIEKQAAEIRQNLKKLNADFADFLSKWDTLGTHVRNLNNKYDEADKKLDRFSTHLTEIQRDDEEAGNVINDKLSDIEEER